MGQPHVNQTTTGPFVECRVKNITIIARPGPHPFDKLLSMPAVSQHGQTPDLAHTCLLCRVRSTIGPNLIIKHASVEVYWSTPLVFEFHIV